MPYLRDADVFVDVFCQEDHVTLLCHHHDEACQSLRIEGVHGVLLLFLIILLFFRVSFLLKERSKLMNTDQNSTWESSVLLAIHFSVTKTSHLSQTSP